MFHCKNCLFRQPTCRTYTSNCIVGFISNSSIKSPISMASPYSSKPTTTSNIQLDHQQSCLNLSVKNLIIDPKSPPKFIQSLSAWDLVSFTLISIITSSPTLINTATKIMHFTPNPLIKMFVYPLYCGGENYAEVVATGKKLSDRGLRNMMVSYSVEDAKEETLNNTLLNNSVSEIMASIDKILVKHYDNLSKLKTQSAVASTPISGYVALKPAGLMPQAVTALKEYNNSDYKQLWEKYLETCRQICQHAATRGQGKVVIVFDAETRILQSGIYQAQRLMMREFNRNGKIIVAGTIQMYLQDSLEQLKSDLEDAKTYKYQLAHKLVRGAYIHSEPNRWNVIHKSKAESDESYNAGVSIMLDHIIDGWNKVENLGDKQKSLVGRVIIASHNEESMALVDKRIHAVFDTENDTAQTKPVKVSREQDESIVFGQLMGMAEDQGEELAKRGHKVVKYVPWGPTGETKEYLIRRLKENGDAVAVGGLAMTKHAFAEIWRRVLKIGFN